MTSPDDFDMQGITEKMVDDFIRNNPFGEFLRVDFTVIKLIIVAEIRIALEIVHVTAVIVSLVIVDILIVFDFSDDFRNII